MPVTAPAYMEVVDFIAGGTTPRQVIDFRPSQAAQDRVSELLQRNRDGQLTDEEKFELDQYVELEHIMRMAKARARQILGGID